MQPRPPNRSKVRALVAEGEHALAVGPHPERARFDAEVLLLHILRRCDMERNRAWLIAHANSPTMPRVGAEFRALIDRRLAGEPIQYITGEAEFYSLPFRATPDVLIPRPETEHLVEKVIELAARFDSPRIADVGAGSGAIAVTLAKNLPQARITAIDISPRALAVARENARRNGAEERIRFLCGDLLRPVEGERFEIVASNPPYVPATDRGTLAVEVRDHEPAMALFAGADGLDVIRVLVPEAYAALVPGGVLAMEFGYGQCPAVNRILEDASFTEIEFVADLQGIPRVALARRPVASVVF
jgi:release factor glutamine methyltransferase